MDLHTLYMVLAILFVIAELALMAFVYMLGFHKGQHFERTTFPHSTGRAEAPKMPIPPQAQGR